MKREGKDSHLKYKGNTNKHYGWDGVTESGSVPVGHADGLGWAEVIACKGGNWVKMGLVGSHYL